jgi:hypothetical protein
MDNTRITVKRQDVQEQYDLLSEKIARFRRELAIETDVAVKLKVEKDLEQAERERIIIEEQLGGPLHKKSDSNDIITNNTCLGNVSWDADKKQVGIDIVGREKADGDKIEVLAGDISSKGPITIGKEIQQTTVVHQHFSLQTRVVIFFALIIFIGGIIGIRYYIVRPFSEKRQLSGLLTRAVFENNELILELEKQQHVLKEASQENMMNLEPFFKIEALDSVSQNPLFTTYCQIEAKDLIGLLTQLRTTSYFARLKAYKNTPEEHQEIDTHISNLKESNQLLSHCITHL